jgi:hypothetical protein
MFHKDLNDGDIHLVYTWEYADATARLAATGFVAGDVGKLAKQASDSTLWMLTDDSPITWVVLGSPYAYAWSYADAATRTGATGFVANDVGKLARQLDNNTLWMLTATTPTWLAVGGSAAWGGITGSIGAQADLVAALATKMTLITANTTLYLATTGNDVTGDGSVGAPWQSLNKVVAYLADKFVIQGVTLTVQLGDGAFVQPSSWDRQDGDRIFIQGTNVYNVVLNSIFSSSVALQIMTVVCNMSSVANIAVDDAVVIRSATGGVNPELMRCCGKITNVDGVNTRITIQTPNKSGVLPSGAVTYASVRVVKTRITATTPIAVTTKSTLNLKNLWIISSAATWTIYISNGGVVNFGSGSTQAIYNVSGSGVYCGLIGAFYGGNQWNAIAAIQYSLFCGGGGYMRALYGVYNGATYSIWVENGGVLELTSPIIVGASVGLHAVSGATVYFAANFLVTRCPTSAIEVQNNSRFTAFGGTVSYSGNSLYASMNSCILGGGVTLTGNAVAPSPTQNTIGNFNSYMFY